MAQDYIKAAEQLTGKIELAEVDATVENELAKKYEVQGFPTLIYFKNGVKDAKDYDGGRTLDKILEWAEGQTSPPVQSVDAAPEPSTHPCIVLYAKEVTAEFEAIADSNRKSGKFYHVVSDANKITHQHPNEDLKEITDMSAESITSFLDENALPLVGELNGDTFEQYTKSGSGLVWCLFPMEAGQLAEVAKEKAPLMQAVAKRVRALKYSVTYTDTAEFAQALEGMLGVTEFPAFVVQYKAGDKKTFLYEGAEEADKIAEYVEAVASGTIVAKLKSEPIPETQEAVKVVVGNNLKEMVFSPTKDVLLEVYAPWCGHCKKLEPEYEKLAEKVVKDADEYVSIAKMDGTANDSPVESMEWSGFPTIFFVKAGSEEVITYDGGRDAASMWKYIKESGANSDKIMATLNTKYDSEAQHDEL